MKPNKSTYKNSEKGFKVPKDYFENFESKLLDRITMNEEVSLPSYNSGFKTPDSYFDSIENEVIQKLDSNKGRVVKLYKKKYFYYAASIAAMLILMLGNFYQAENSGDSLSWDSVEVSAFENYIDESYEMGYIDFTTSDYSQLIFDDGRLIDDSDFNSVDSEAVLEYIDENAEYPSQLLD